MQTVSVCVHACVNVHTDVTPLLFVSHLFSCAIAVVFMTSDLDHHLNNQLFISDIFIEVHHPAKVYSHSNALPAAQYIAFYRVTYKGH